MVLALLTRTGGRVVGDRVGHKASEQHRLQQIQRLLWFSALLTGADGRAVSEHVGQEASEQHRLQQMQLLLRCFGPSHMR